MEVGGGRGIVRVGGGSARSGKGGEVVWVQVRSALSPVDSRRINSAEVTTIDTRILAGYDSTMTLCHTVSVTTVQRP
jgi:hypothetical protein